jgi:SAM-dependent methyltransferase
LDVGCGTGALSQAILDLAAPEQLTGVDASESYVAFSREHVRGARARFVVGDAQALLEPGGAYDVAVSGLMLNFVPEPSRAVAEMARVTRGGGTIAAYVWDYAGEMQLIRRFWDAAVAINPAVRELDEGVRFPLCRPEPLAALFHTAGLTEVDVRAIDVPTVFRDFEDYWQPFLGGQGPAPGYVMSLHEDQRADVRERLRAALPVRPDGSIPLIARAWAVRGDVARA